MKTKILKTFVALPIALILCLGAMLSFNRTLGSIDSASDTSVSFSAATIIEDNAPFDQSDFRYSAWILIYSWYSDCYGYIYGNNQEADAARELLNSAYSTLLGDLQGKLATDNLFEFVIYSYNKLDGVFYSWELKSYLVELEEAYGNFKNSGYYKENKDDIDGAYNKAKADIMAIINEFNKTLDETDYYSYGLIKTRMGYVSDIEEILEIKRQWNNGSMLYNAKSLISSWRDDCIGYLTDEDPATIKALNDKYAELVAYLEDPANNEPLDNNFIINPESDNFNSQVVAYIGFSFDQLDLIFYGWELNDLNNKLDEAYKRAKGNGAAIEDVYKKAKAAFSAADDAYSDPANNESAIDRSITRSKAYQSAFDEALTGFEEIKQQYDLIFWLSISGGILLLAAIVVITLLLILRKRNATLVTLKDLQKTMEEENRFR